MWIGTYYDLSENMTDSICLVASKLGHSVKNKRKCTYVDVHGHAYI
jgi:hypothetical protein